MPHSPYIITLNLLYILISHAQKIEERNFNDMIHAPNHTCTLTVHSPEFEAGTKLIKFPVASLSTIITRFERRSDDTQKALEREPSRLMYFACSPSRIV